ncbi:hypothetical protein AQUCO_00300095v1 [Aquilegia coerulea]|uniref:Uncharacterized protein n=1 Tax=Aquilegia coerulea TaxID=218851 RepID=A0A2G5EX99_AQUCA|nr:hypothetical protein AQUCO_00300095v1 [Aquilegia coerulea]
MTVFISTKCMQRGKQWPEYEDILPKYFAVSWESIVSGCLSIAASHLLCYISYVVSMSCSKISLLSA